MRGDLAITTPTYIHRPARPSDIPFIYSTWLESYRYDSDIGKSHRNSVFFENYRKVLDTILERSDLIVACLPDEEDFIAGYIVFEPTIIHYIYTRGTLKHFGIARELYRDAFKGQTPEYCSHKTMSTSLLIKRLEPMSYNAFLLYQKGDTQNA